MNYDMICKKFLAIYFYNCSEDMQNKKFSKSFTIFDFCSAWDQSWTLNLPYTPPPLPTTETFRPLPGILGGWDYVDLTHKY